MGFRTVLEKSIILAFLAGIGAIAVGYTHNLNKKLRLGLPLTETEQAAVNLVAASQKEGRERKIRELDEKIAKLQGEKMKLLHERG